ncbi:conserved Plasmodium protein, unknown function [Plasmodium berghei]|uniref:Serpentine receptor n=2 Tax=Plasmodium berghei TaxID=5821 RepID=A0A509AS74_PLABA|nr:conserved protein, unknown function [Plasmodium berghei ANKA]CXI97452.1 conserved Plasmodium protein, unknown function [Plasmodium berghei]SCL97534.1 conserved Plasmodium protein, unknown function [Plasmodium berghei]SCM16629.1 conserved Plasmodium protein, unknown function [Plasmodium berghei]SCM18426.1 conserved Plasmodium protein, unknown function [Plasmodium berghei]SCN27856.1 conserved Plasmodium protein, unknown function [Plasmodium berghei]|eukprot:XP_034423511.1 conserved protein, unknown function [Plasmodium berghei ANKA]
MRLKTFFFSIGLFLLINFFCIKKSIAYILNVNVVDKDDIFIFLYKNEQLLAASYYNFKPSYFFSVEEGEIDIDMNIFFKENKTKKTKSNSQEILAKANKNSISLLDHFNVDKEYFSKKINVLNNEKYEYINKNEIKESEITNIVPNELNNGITSRHNEHNNSTISDKFSNVFLVLMTADQWLNYIRLKNKLEPSIKNDDSYIFTSHFNSIKRYPINRGIIKKTIKITQKNRYMLFLINSNKLIINMKGNIVFYDYKTKHLSHDFIFIPNVLHCVVYILLTIIVILIPFFIKYRQKLDLFMILNMLFFLLSTYYNYKNVNFIQDTGYMYTYFWVAANIFKKIQDIISFIIYLQVSLGDIYVRSHLSRIEIQFMICYSVISFYTGIFEIFLGNFQTPRYILQTFAYLFIFIAINFTSTFLSARLSEEGLSFNVAELYTKHQIYKKYRIIFFVVILKPIFLIIYKVLCLSPSNIDLYSPHEFLYVFFDIIFDIVLYVMLFALFRAVKPLKILKHILSNEDFHIN